MPILSLYKIVFYYLHEISQQQQHLIFSWCYKIIDNFAYVIVIIMETIKIILLVMMVVCTISLVQATQNCQPESTTSGSLNSQIIPSTYAYLFS